ncbi:Arc family DNA-binding protein [uncultured Bosea sp.]|uniref:Arc family DNA-binding protein n=1 Tax=uncultured Bosea sp. TaxID=211457 RepID=UPI0025FD02DE|nr:Arc family DNA-binding protein [uncultured Bosea sp.]
MPQETPSRDLDKVIVRLPDGVRQQLKLQADHNKRSMNAEIVARLLESLEPWVPGDDHVVYKEEKISFPAETYDLNELLGRLEKLTDKVSKAAGRDRK